MLKDFDARQRLGESFAFRSLNALERQRLYAFCQNIFLKKNKVLFRQNIQTDQIYFLLEGVLKTEKEVILPGTFLNLENLFTRHQQSQSIKTALDSVLIKIPCQMIHELMRANAKLAFDLSAFLHKQQTQKKPAQIIAIMPNRQIFKTARLALQLALSIKQQFKKKVLLIDFHSDPKNINEILEETKNYDYLILHLSNNKKDNKLTQIILQCTSVLIGFKLNKNFSKRFYLFKKEYSLKDGVDRLARQIACKTIGIALSSGLASSLYHVGVLKAFKQARVPIDAIAGCSGGALVGSLFTNGKKFAEIDQFLQHMIHKPFYRHFHLQVRPTHLVSFTPILKSLKKFLGERKLDQADIPLQVVTTDLKTKKKHVFKKGDMYHAVGASFSMPFLTSHFSHKQKLLVDGYLTEPVPTPTLKEAGIDYVVAVDVTDDGMTGDIKHFMDLYFHTRRTLTSNLRQSALKQSDVIIQPQFKKYKPLDYSLYPEYLKMGERAARKIIPQIKKYLIS